MSTTTTHELVLSDLTITVEGSDPVTGERMRLEIPRAQTTDSDSIKVVEVEEIADVEFDTEKKRPFPVTRSRTYLEMKGVRLMPDPNGVLYMVKTGEALG